MPNIQNLLLTLVVLSFVMVAPAALAMPAVTAGPIVAAGLGDAVTAAPKKRRRRRRKKKKKKKAKEVRGQKEETKEEKKAARGKKLADDVPAKAEPAGEQNLGGLRRSNSMEFDARLVTGERPQAGAVYLFQRAPRQLPALVKLRQSYLRDIIDPVLGPKYSPATAKKKGKRKKAATKIGPDAKKKSDPKGKGKGKKGRR